jgi:ribose transport system ATP-binding protein
MNRPAEAALRISALAKHFGGTAALSGIDLHVRRGTVHALLGGNGSGKSTTIKILAGVHQADAGTIEINGHSWDATRFPAATAHTVGLRFVHQDLGVFDDLSVAENFALAAGWPTHAGVRVDWSALHRRVAQLLDRFEIDADPRDRLGSLRPAARTMVAIARALQDTDRPPAQNTHQPAQDTHRDAQDTHQPAQDTDRDAQDTHQPAQDTDRDDRGGHGSIVVLDEPTASLPEQEAGFLLAAVRRLADQGQTVILVSHRLNEVLSVADEYTVLRDGKVAGTLKGARPTEAELVELIAGRTLEEAGQSAPPTGRPRPALTVTGLAGGPLKGVDLQVGAGEIVGIAGLLGSGRSALLRALFGAHRPDHGTVELDGTRLSLTHPDDAMHAGIAYVPEDRGGDAAFTDLPLRCNLSMSVLREYWRRWRLDLRAERQDGHLLIDRYRVKSPSIEAPFGALSGGNQQKAVLARWLRRDPRLLLLDEPTQGVDVMSRADIYGMVRESAADGCAVLVVSSDFEELAALSDRVLVMQAGRIVAEADADGLTADRLVHLVQRSPSLTSGART